jgi:WD40 repeat protein
MKQLFLSVFCILLISVFGCRAMDGLKKDLDEVLQKMEMEELNPKEEKTPKESISSHVSKPLEEAPAKKNEPARIKQRPDEVEYSLTINPVPEKSVVKLLNIDEQYYPGIKLSPGYYEVMIESKGYEGYREWIKLDRDKVLKISLSKTGAAKVSAEESSAQKDKPVHSAEPVQTKKPLAEKESPAGAVLPEPAAGLQLPDTLSGHLDSVSSLSISTDSSLLASGSYDAAVIIWSLKDGSIAHKINHGDKVRAVSFAPGGTSLASGGNDKLVKLWDSQNGNLINTFRGLADRAYCIEFAPGGQTIAAGGNNELIIWNTGSGKIEHHLKGDVAPYPRFGAIKAIAFHPSGRDANGFMLAFTSQTGIALFNPQNKEVRILPDASSPASVTYSPGGHYIAWGARHQRNENAYFPRLLKTATREMDADIFRDDAAAAADRVFYTAYVPGGRQLIMLSYNQAVLYDIKTGSIIRKFPGTSATAVTAASLSPDGKILAATSGNTIRIWKMD